MLRQPPSPSSNSNTDPILIPQYLWEPKLCLTEIKFFEQISKFYILKPSFVFVNKYYVKLSNQMGFIQP